jgi:hypothetical protein
MSDNVFYDMQWLADLATVVMSGLMQGGVYAMFAVGLTLIFGVMRVINVAHGEFVVLGAYLTFVVFNSPQFLGYGVYIDPLLAMFITLPIAFCLGYLVQKVLLNAVVGGPELTSSSGFFPPTIAPFLIFPTLSKSRKTSGWGKTRSSAFLSLSSLPLAFSFFSSFIGWARRFAPPRKMPTSPWSAGLTFTASISSLSDWRLLSPLPGELWFPFNSDSTPRPD